MDCPKCSSNKVNMKGMRRGKQRYRCRDCGTWFSVKNQHALEQNESKKQDKLFIQIAQRYSPDELRAIANGQGTIKTGMAKPVNFSGDLFKFMFITDTHEGSQWVKDEWLESAIEVAHEEKVDELWHAGDVTEGMSGRDGHVYELRHIGYKAQRDHSVERFKPFGIPIKMISGNHDLWFMSKGDMGADIVEDICSRIDGAEYLGMQEADILVNGVRCRLFHGEDASSYAISYRPQKIIESFSGGEKPAWAGLGHDHKAGEFFLRNVFTVLGGCMQQQTPWMRRKKMAAMPGFSVITLCIADKEIKWMQRRFYPFYK